MGFLLNEMHPDAISQQLFENVCVRPQYIFNFLLDHGLTFFDLHAFHSRQYFMECYEKSNVYSFHHAPKVGSQTDNVKILHYQELKTKDARVEFIQAWSEQYNQSQSSQY